MQLQRSLLKCAKVSAFALTVFFVTLARAEDSNSKEIQNLTCLKGPAHANFGSSDWLIYACSDGYSVAFASAPGSPASPFFFIARWQDNRFKFNGQGTGDKAATDRAWAEISKLDSNAISKLHSDASNVAP